jgi:uncharacterized protein YwgA
LPIEIEVYEPLPDPHARLSHPSRASEKHVSVTLPLAIVGELIRRARARMPSSSALGRLLVQKLAFFAQMAGAPIELRFDKYNFGPFDHNVSHMIDRLEGLYIRDDSASWKRSELRMLDEPAWMKAIEPHKAALEAHDKYIEAAVDLLLNRPLEEVELLATVEYGWARLVGSGEEGSEDQVERFVSEWSEEKRERFPRSRVRHALEILHARGWLGPTAAEAPSPLVEPNPAPGNVLLPAVGNA